jgi:hypothetical protein
MEMSFPIRATQVEYRPKTRIDWLIHFRRAVAHETLDHMAERCWGSIGNPKDKAEMWLAYGDRQEEIDRGQFAARRHA